MPGCLRLMTIFALQTAACRGELLSLTWEAVHPENVELCETKDSENRSIRLNRDAKAVLELLITRETEAKEFVFEPAFREKRLYRRSATTGNGGEAIRHRKSPLSRSAAHGPHALGAHGCGFANSQRHRWSRFSQNHAALPAFERLSDGDFGATFTTTPQEAVEQISVPATIQ